MKKQLIGYLIATASVICSSPLHAVGFKTIQIEDPDNPALTVGVWYPSDTPNPKVPNTGFGMALAVDAPVGRSNGSLIVISHGYSGWYAGHADTAIALAEAGYIVAAPSHTGNTWSDMSSPPQKWLLDRPRHISKVIDHLLEADSLSSDITSKDIGLYGFSAGGYTALGLLGGVPDLAHAKQHCGAHPSEFVCSEGLINAMYQANMAKLPDPAWGADARIQAAVISAPGWAFAYPESSLTNVSADIQLWSGQLDTDVPTKTNAAYLATQLATPPETYWIDNANHFAFLTMPCRESFKNEDPDEYEVVCADAPGFDRYEFHDNMHREMVRFFNDSLLK